tara:strand:+ start:90556 stop:91188 length:633 start_codon:yes stop_codon:yes gene_type:complete
MDKLEIEWAEWGNEMTNFGRDLHGGDQNITFIILTHVKLHIVLIDRVKNRLNRNIATVNEKQVDEICRNFDPTLKFAYSIGIIDSNTFGALKKFSRLRNDIAHKEGFKVTNKHIREILSAAPDSLKIQMMKLENPIDHLRNFIFNAYMELKKGLYMSNPLNKDGKTFYATLDDPYFCGIESEAYINKKITRMLPNVITEMPAHYSDYFDE